MYMYWSPMTVEQKHDTVHVHEYMYMYMYM